MFGRRTAVLWSIALAACPGKPKPELCLPVSAPKGMTTAKSQEAIGVPGQQYTATMLTPLVTNCDGGELAVERVDLEILAPGGGTVPATAKMQPLMGQTESADVTFVPIETGQYLVIARFEPNIGLAQTLVNVAYDRRHAGNSFFATNLNCAPVTLAAGALLCQTLLPVQRVLRTIVNGTLRDSLSIVAFSRVGDVIWVIQGSPNIVSRYTVDAQGLFSETAQSAPLDSPYSFIVAWEDGALVSGQMLTQLQLETDGGITPVHEWFNNAGTGAYLDVTPGVGAVAIDESGGPIWTADFGDPDAGMLDDTGLSMGQAIGSDGVGIWSLTTTQLQVSRLGADGKVVTASLASSTISALDTTSAARAPPQGAPILASSTGTVVPRLTDAGIALDLFPTFDPANIRGVDSACLYEAVDGGVRCWAR